MRLPAIRATWGAALLLAPDVVLGIIGQGRVDTRTRRVTQVLGGRELLQGLLASRHCSRSWVLRGAAVDGTHAVTMLALAVRRPASRRPATASALAATSLAVAGVVRGRRVP
ncbi:hypothetical protein FSW04_01640 [Baekduia soli]|uniref:DUF4267 domain-containing protein n=1 Tax=Baekduia soli TaxID=496014 RepID=A0A5B8U092_9ACTN|nr:hypothetical protein [Baekduia soli]QEC46407.1 hypothetical protein FSW04_01640 [Baekduia soli]